MREPLGLQLLRSTVAVGLALILTLLTALLVIGCLPAARAAIEPLFSPGSETPKLALGLLVIFVVLLPLVVVSLAARRRRLTWTVLAVSWVAILPVLAWLAWDDPAVRLPLTIEEFSPAFPGADKSYAVLMQYSKQTPSEEAKVFGKARWAVEFAATASTRDAAKWLEFVTKNRAAIEQEWAALAPQRRWLAELAAFDHIGDLTPADPTANILTFQLWRVLAQRTCAIATLQAIDGHGDEAIATLVPLLEVGRGLQPSSRTLVRTMIGVVVERMVMETAGIVLDQTPVSARSRARLGAALAGENAPALARRLILVEYVLFAPLLSHMKLGDFNDLIHERQSVLRRPLNFLSGLFLNPIATVNIYGDQARALADLAEARELGKFAVRSKAFGDTMLLDPGMKNIGGRLVLNLALPALDKVVESHWKTADIREALRKRLADTR